MKVRRIISTVHLCGVRLVSILSLVLMASAIALFVVHCAGKPRYTRFSTGNASILVKKPHRPASKHSTQMQEKKQVQPETSQPSPAALPSPETPNFYQTGKASYYANKFHGRKTASGERYNKTAFTAAHRTLPFGTMARITNFATKKSVVVRINDRGPFTKRRVIDLSAAAAEALAMKRAGVAMVGIAIVSGD